MNDLAHKFYSLSLLPALRRKLQPTINNLYWDETNQTTINRGAKWDYVEVDGLKYAYYPVLVGELRRRDDAIFRGLRSTDVVLDIGSNIGDVAIPAATLCKMVCAYEPVFYSVLERNITVNQIQNIVRFKAGLGDCWGMIDYEYAGAKETSLQIPFRQMLLNTVLPIDFLRCDCEGGEWYIDPDDCKGIREMRFEFHIRKAHQKDDDKQLTAWIIWLNQSGYKIDMKKIAEWSGDFRVQYDVAASKI